MDTRYNTIIRECSKELSVKQKVALKNLQDVNKLDEILDTVEEVAIDVDYYVILDIHNERAENTDYTVYVIVDKDGQRYITSSDSFFTSFVDIFNEVKDIDEEWKLKVFKKPSNNYKGKFFLTCSII